MKIELKLTLPPTLNEYIDANNTHRFKSAKMKKEWTERLAWEIKAQPRKKFTVPVNIVYFWVCPNKKKDKDNIAYGKKFINDALVVAGVLPNDGWNDIHAFEDRFSIDKTNPRVEVWIDESDV